MTANKLHYILSLNAATNSEKKSNSYVPIQQQMPIMVHLTQDKFNQQQEEVNANLQFSHGVVSHYVDLNCACNIESLTTLVVFHIFIT